MRKEIIFSMLMILVVVSVMGSVGAEEGETFVVSGREFTRYGNITVESSILNALTIENQTKILAVIRINETFSQQYDKIKSEIISNLTEEEFELRGTIAGRDLIVGYLTLSGLEKLKNNLYVSIIHEETIGTIALQQSLPLINATKVWDEGYTGEGQTICVIDSGVNASHPDLQGKVIAEKCYCINPEGANSGITSVQILKGLSQDHKVLPFLQAFLP